MNRETYMAANQVIKRYGNEAEDHAWIRMTELLNGNDEKEGKCLARYYAGHPSSTK